MDYLKALGCPNDFDYLKGKPIITAFSGVQTVKVAYDIQADSLYFFSSSNFELHWDFCRQILGYPGDHSLFNATQYFENPNRLYWLPTLNYYTSSDIYTLEFWAGDDIAPEQILSLFNKIRSKIYFSDELKFMPVSGAHLEILQQFRDILPVITSAEVFVGQDYQPLNPGYSYGYLVKKDVKEVERSYLSPRDIVLTNGVPNDIPVVSGIITTAFQTPLSHINVLSQKRQTPNMALKSGWEDEEIQSLIGSLVYLEVRPEGYTLKAANLDSAKAFWAAREPGQVVSLACVDTVSGLFLMPQLSFNSVSIVGGKAAGFAELSNMKTSTNQPMPVPEGAFAIPFFYYRQHIIQNNLAGVVDSLLGDSAFNANAQNREIALQIFRKRITLAPIDPAFAKLVRDTILSRSEYRKTRFRSSTNAEDLPQFNGAGLYSSYTGIVDDPSKSIEQAIKKVWASLWNFRAFEERSYYKIDHRSIAMGVLVHRSFPNEMANGVAITRHIYNPTVPGYTINVQKGEVSIVNPPKGIFADEMVFYTGFQDSFTKPAIEFFSNSSLSNGQPVLTVSETVELARILSEIKSWFYFNVFSITGSVPFHLWAMDVEFKLDSPNRRLYIKQARVY